MGVVDPGCIVERRALLRHQQEPSRPQLEHLRSTCRQNFRSVNLELTDEAYSVY